MKALVLVIVSMYGNGWARGNYHAEISTIWAVIMWFCFAFHKSTNRPFAPTIEFFAHAALYLG
jgi:hypothetical protein